MLLHDINLMMIIQRSLIFLHIKLYLEVVKPHYCLPRSTLVVFKAAGHFLHRERVCRHLRVRPKAPIVIPTKPWVVDF